MTINNDNIKYMIDKISMNLKKITSLSLNFDK